MRRLMNFAIALAAAMVLSAGAKAAQIVLDVTTPAAQAALDAGCAAPCFEVKAYLALNSDELTIPIESIQFEVRAGDGATIPVLPSPPATNALAISPNSFSLVGFTNGPWGLNSSVGESPNRNQADPAKVFQGLWVLAANAPFTFNAFAANYPTVPQCAGATCASLVAGVNGIHVGSEIFHAIYLGSIHATITGTFFDVGNIQGTQDVINDIRAFHTGAGGRLDCVDGICAATPEPAGIVMLGFALAGFALARRRA